jgi:rhamnosyltransferase
VAYEVKVSIVILTKNGGDLFKTSIDTIFKQKFSSPFEVVVVDSGSTDSTLDVLKKYPVRLFQIPPEEFKFGPTRDFGFEQTQGEIIVTLSQDVIPIERDWLTNLLSPFGDPTVSAVQGTYTISPQLPFFYWDMVGYFYFTRETNKWKKLHHGFGLSCTNLAIRKEVWEKCRFGDVPMCEDKEIQRKLSEGKFKVIRTDQAKTYHNHVYTLSTLMKRCENEGWGWKYVGIRYSSLDLFWDLFSPKKYYLLLRGLIAFRIRNLAELLFPFIRPICFYKGNHFNTRYRF